MLLRSIHTATRHFPLKVIEAFESELENGSASPRSLESFIEQPEIDL